MRDQRARRGQPAKAGLERPFNLGIEILDQGTARHEKAKPHRAHGGKRLRLLLRKDRIVGGAARHRIRKRADRIERIGQRERALRFERLSYRALAEGLISLSKGAELLRLPVFDVEAGLKGPQSANADHR